jgi:predicted exporter
VKPAWSWLWLLTVLAAIVFLVLRLTQGIALQSNILALMPPAQRDAGAQSVQDRVTNAFARRIVVLVGHDDPAVARSAALRMAAALKRSGLFGSVTSQVGPREQQEMAGAYYPYRSGLLSDADRQALEHGQGQRLVDRAFSVIYGPANFANARLIGHDPFLLLPNFLVGLPLPQSKLALEDGVLSVRDGQTRYVFISAELAGDPFATEFQESFHAAFENAVADTAKAAPGLKMLRAGAIFYAREGAANSMSETSTLGLISIAGTLGLILLVFRGVRPIALGLLAIGVGILFAFDGTLLLFGSLHVISLLFGVSLIGISVDYSLQYFCEYFDPDAVTPSDRLRRVLPGVALGLATTLIGYLTLLLAPVPGLQQVAAFSVIGLSASVLTVVLWYPRLDAQRAPRLGTWLMALARQHWLLWEARSYVFVRTALVLGCIALGVLGSRSFRVDDDVRHLQSLSPTLKHEESEVQRLTGSGGATAFLLVRGTDEQALLRTEERLNDRLSAAQRQGVLSNFEMVSQFVPSIARQAENRRLVEDRLVSQYLAGYLAQIGYSGGIDNAPPKGFLTAASLPTSGPLSLISLLTIGKTDHPAHVILLGRVTRPDVLSASLKDVPEVRLVDLTDDWSKLFGAYRQYAILLLAASAILMYPALAWRYGMAAALRVMAPSIAAAALTPPIAALFGVAFTFFNAMALVLVLSVGVDYSVFCRETGGVRKPVTIIAIALAALSTIISFGLLSLSQTFAVHAFGVTMLIGVGLSFLFAPAAGDAQSASRKAIAS